jgi:hypothetical protein
MAGRTSGLGPSSATSTPTSVGASVRLGKLVGGSADAQALIVLVALEMLLQIVLRRGPFRRSHGG